MVICIGNKPCRYKLCKHYIEDCCSEEYQEMECCGRCARAYHNRTKITLSLPSIKPEIKDYFITYENLKKRRHNKINSIITFMYYVFLFWFMFTISAIVLWFLI